MYCMKLARLYGLNHITCRSADPGSSGISTEWRNIDLCDTLFVFWWSSVEKGTCYRGEMPALLISCSLGINVRLRALPARGTTMMDRCRAHSGKWTSALGGLMANAGAGSHV
nr:hypothetical protein CFP56_64739 [Quercus suber]